MMIEKGTYTELANANAKAIQGMAPKVSYSFLFERNSHSTGTNDILDDHLEYRKWRRRQWRRWSRIGRRRRNQKHIPNASSIDVNDS